MSGQRVYEYETTCETCGKSFGFGLTVPAETIAEADLAGLLDRLHRCEVEE